jgi:hypothetical protein
LGSLIAIALVASSAPAEYGGAVGAPRTCDHQDHPYVGPQNQSAVGTFREISNPKADGNLLDVDGALTAEADPKEAACVQRRDQ